MAIARRGDRTSHEWDRSLGKASAYQRPAGDDSGQGRCFVTKQSPNLARNNNVSLGRIDYASMVQSHAPELVDSVIDGITSLDAAYRVAHQRKIEAEALTRRVAALKRSSLTRGHGKAA